MDYRTRMLRFYNHYNPEKLSLVDEALQAYAGKEEELMRTLVAKYGPEPVPASTTSPPEGTATKGTDYRTRVIGLFQKYKPDKVDSVDAMLQKYVGQEESLIEALVAKYGPEPEIAPVSKSDDRVAVNRFVLPLEYSERLFTEVECQYAVLYEEMLDDFSIILSIYRREHLLVYIIPTLMMNVRQREHSKRCEIFFAWNSWAYESRASRHRGRIRELRASLPYYEFLQTKKIHPTFEGKRGTVACQKGTKITCNTSSCCS